MVHKTLSPGRVLVFIFHLIMEKSDIKIKRRSAHSLQLTRSLTKQFYPHLIRKLRGLSSLAESRGPHLGQVSEDDCSQRRGASLSLCEAELPVHSF